MFQPICPSVAGPQSYKRAPWFLSAPQPLCSSTELLTRALFSGLKGFHPGGVWVFDGLNLQLAEITSGLWFFFVAVNLLKMPDVCFSLYLP